MALCDQDKLGVQGARVAGVDLSGCESDCTNVWSKPLTGNGNPGTAAMVYLNTGTLLADGQAAIDPPPLFLESRHPCGPQH